MILIKCKCGCFFTLKDNTPFEDRSSHTFKCANCNESIYLSVNEDLQYIRQKSQENGMKVYFIPDDTEIKFNFS